MIGSLFAMSNNPYEDAEAAAAANRAAQLQELTRMAEETQTALSPYDEMIRRHFDLVAQARGWHATSLYCAPNLPSWRMLFSEDGKTLSNNYLEIGLIPTKDNKGEPVGGVLFSRLHSGPDWPPEGSYFSPYDTRLQQLPEGALFGVQLKMAAKQYLNRTVQSTDLTEASLVDAIGGAFGA